MEKGEKDKDLVIGGERIAPGQRKLIRIDIARLPSGTLIDMPVHVFRAKEPGPVVLFQAGLHGDEVNGVETLRRMLEQKAFGLIRGTVLVVPVLNVFGFIHFSRDVPDGKDVNRSFPGSRSGSLASRIAYHCTQELLPLVDVGIDFHTGGGQRHNFPQVRYTEGDEKGRELARAFGAPFYFSSPLITGSFRKAAHRKGKTMIVYEGGESMRFDETAIATAMRGIHNILVHLGMGHGSRTEGQCLELFSRQWVRASRAGMFVPGVANGSAVEKGDILGVVVDTLAKKSKKIKAPFSGFVCCLNHQAVVNQGDALFHLGNPTEKNETDRLVYLKEKGPK